MTRRGALWTLLVAGLLLFGWLAAIDERMWAEGGPGIIGFEVAGSAENADRILAEWGPDGRDAARLSLWLDFLFLAGYAVFWALAARAARDHAGERGWRTLARAHRLWILAPAAAGFDALENVCLLNVLGGGGSAWPVLAAVFAGLKFLLLGVVEAYVALVLIRRFPRTFAALVAAGVIAVVVNAVLVSRATEPARADAGGRILELRAGDIHVRESGPRDGRPVVLIHGYSVSMRWWEPLLAELPDDLRVIRIDLLGHGGSEKPRDGYSLENQADVVAQAMDELGVPAAPVVGHSMGGMVATALVERHRSKVQRMMMIGTPPDRKDVKVGLLSRAAYSPLVGQAHDTLVQRRLVEWAVEGGFAPEFDPPDELARDIFERTTWSSFKGSADALLDYWDDEPLNERLADEGVPVTVLVGEKERHAKRSVRIYNTLPRARTVVMEGLDHSPNVESPRRTAPLVAAFARGL